MRAGMMVHAWRVANARARPLKLDVRRQGNAVRHVEFTPRRQDRAGY
jgi:hypothetical protein